MLKQKRSRPITPRIKIDREALPYLLLKKVVMKKWRGDGLECAGHCVCENWNYACNVAQEHHLGATPRTTHGNVYYMHT